MCPGLYTASRHRGKCGIVVLAGPAGDATLKGTDIQGIVGRLESP